MPQIRILTAGESHGKALIGILEGMPAGVKIEKEKIDLELQRRQMGFGRSERQKIESDRVEILSGIRFGVTLGSPIAIQILNRDWENWEKRMDPWVGEETQPVEIPRPGHGDLAGAIKYGHRDIRNILERASARETAMRVAIGAILRQFLELFGIWIGSHVIQIHSAMTEKTFRSLMENETSPEKVENEILEMVRLADHSEVRCSNPEVETTMRHAIQIAQEKGDTVGGQFEVVALHVPIGLGSHVAWDRRLDAEIAFEMMSIPGIKSVEIGLGTECGLRYGSETHDAIFPGNPPIRKTNRAGGIEAGISNGQPILARSAMKPIPTLRKPLPSVHLFSGKPVEAHHERSDICAVPSASIVGEAMLAIALSKAFMDRFGGDHFEQIQRRFYDEQRRKENA